MLLAEDLGWRLNARTAAEVRRCGRVVFDDLGIATVVLRASARLIVEFRRELSHTSFAPWYGLATFPYQGRTPSTHAQFETIHPFLDGNGRTGRALIHVVLRRRGLAVAYVPPVSVVLAAHKPRYIDGLTRFRADDVDGWLTAFAAACARAARLATTYLEAVENLQERWRMQLRDAVHPRGDAAAWHVVDVLPAHPVLTLPVAVTAVKRPRLSSTKHLHNLKKQACCLGWRVVNVTGHGRPPGYSTCSPVSKAACP